MGENLKDITGRIREAELRSFIRRLTPGRFEGELNLTWLGSLGGGRPLWHHNPLRGKKRFRYVAADGTRVEPGSFETDFGSIPKIAWSLNFNPCAYAAYICHDWLFEQHHAADNRKNVPCSFERANELLAEGIYTQMVVGFGPNQTRAPREFHNLHTIYLAVQSSIGRKIWDAPRR